MARALLAYMDEDDEHCIGYLKKDLELCGENPKAHLWLARVMRRQRKFAEAIEEYLKSLAERPRPSLTTTIRREISETREMIAGKISPPSRIDEVKTNRP